MLHPRAQAELQRLMTTTEKEYKSKLKMNNNSTFAINLVRDLHLKVNSIVKQVKDNGVKFHCEKGCSYCCNLRVEALAPEIFYIAKQLRSTLSESELDLLIQNLHQYSIKAKNLKAEEHFLTCLFLIDNKCSIYAFRPMMCRKYNSLDIEKCKDPNGDAPESMEITLKTTTVGQAFNAAFQSKKISAIPHELGQALYIALSDESAEQRWFSGDIVFGLIPEMK